MFPAASLLADVQKLLASESADLAAFTSPLGCLLADLALLDCELANLQEALVVEGQTAAEPPAADKPDRAAVAVSVSLIKRGLVHTHKKPSEYQLRKSGTLARTPPLTQNARTIAARTPTPKKVSLRPPTPPPRSSFLGDMAVPDPVSLLSKRLQTK